MVMLADHINDEDEEEMMITMIMMMMIMETVNFMIIIEVQGA